MTLKYFIVFITACIACNCLHAQSLYNFKYQFQGEKGVELYDAFMVRYDDGTGFIRVNFADEATGERYLVDMDMEESYAVDDKTGAVDSNTLYFEGISPLVISGDTLMGYDPDIYVFEMNENSGYYEPAEVISDQEDGTETTGEFTYAKLLEPEDLNEEFVAQYFFKTEDFYKSLFETKVRQLSGAEKAATLHLLIVANTNDPDIGSTCVLDKDKTHKNFKDLAEFLGIRLDEKLIFGDNYSKQNVVDAIGNMHASPQDIVVFYYSGHGFSKPDNYQYPYLELRSKSFQDLDMNSLNIEDIYKEIRNKGAKVSLVISDCCNSVPGASATVNGSVALTRSSSLGWSLNNCFQLFMPPRPVAILMTAAAKGEMSAGNNNFGGFFTYNLSSSLLNFLSPMHELTGVSWPQLITEAKNQTVKKASNTLCTSPDGPSARCAQHPVYFIQ